MNAEQRPFSARAGGVAIAAIALLFLLLAGGWLLFTRAPVAGTNSVAPRYSLPALTPGHRLCLSGLTLPADANAVSFYMAAVPGGSSRVTMRLSAAGRTQVSHALVPSDKFGGEFRFSAVGREVPARACFTTARALATESGMFGTASGAGVAKLDGKPIGMLSVKYLRLPARRLIAALPAGAHRASLFRAGFVGAWTYAVLALLVLLIWMAGLRIVLRGMR